MNCYLFSAISQKKYRTFHKVHNLYKIEFCKDLKMTKHLYSKEYKLSYFCRPYKPTHETKALLARRRIIFPYDAVSLSLCADRKTFSFGKEGNQ